MDRTQTMRLNLVDRHQTFSNLAAIVAGSIAIITVLDLITTASYIAGYLYALPILVASIRCGKQEAFWVTGICVAIHMGCYWLAPNNIHDPREVWISLINRIISGIALLLLGYLGARMRQWQIAVDTKHSELAAYKQTVALREEFCQTIAHDLKTPLLGSLLTIEALEQGEFGEVSETVESVLHKIYKSNQSSLELLDTVLYTYRYENKAFTLQLETVDLSLLAREVVLSLSPLAKRKEMEVVVEDGERAYLVQGDVQQLDRVLNNLIGNAIKYSYHRSEVRIRFEIEDGNVILKIIDWGIGTPPEVLPHLFDRFYRGHIERDQRGTGLGLYLCKQIIAAHEGIIWAEHNLPQGTILAFKLKLSGSN
jgi:two-component system, NarL family, sensor kinase